MRYNLQPVTKETAMLVFGDQFTDDTAEKVEAYRLALVRQRPYWLADYIPSYTTILLHYRHIDFETLQVLVDEQMQAMPELRKSAKAEQKKNAKSVLQIPVCYDETLAPDLVSSAELLGITAQQLIKKHTAPTYHAYALGFMPGFAFLGRLDDDLVLPRLETPRHSVPAGSVAITEQQTTIYPDETPGGWRIIGRTPYRLYDPNEEPPIKIQVGSKVQFIAISLSEYEAMVDDSDSANARNAEQTTG